MITLITGPMYSSKSTMLLQKMERAILAREKVALIRPKKDTRNYFTHLGINDKLISKWISEDKLKLYDLTEFDFWFVKELNEENYNSIFVDEYFMINSCISLVRHINSDTDIYLSGLLATSECELFEETKDILPYCDEIIKLNGICYKCGSQLGNYSWYMKGHKTESIVVGGESEYQCLCRKCYLKETVVKDVELGL